jgi:two-component system OmpR family sensor kinase
MRRLIPQSLLHQLILAQCLTLLLAAVAMPLLLSRLLIGVGDAFVETRLSRDADRITSALRRDGDRWHIRADRRLDALYGGSTPSRVYAIIDDKERLLVASRSHLGIPRVKLSGFNTEHFAHYGTTDLLIRPLPSAAGEVWLIVAQDKRHPEVIVDDVIADFLTKMIWIVPAVLVASLFVTAALTRRATRGVERVALEANAIAPESLDTRLSTEHLPTEIRPLVRAANLALDRLETGYRAQGEFVANVAHELRTPLALIALRAEAAPDPELRGQLNDAVGRASHVVSQLMELAFLDSAAPMTGPMDLTALAASAVETQAPLVFRSGRSISYVDNGAGKIAIGSPGLVLIALANLIDNAIRHTPQGTSIEVEVHDNATITVSDDGPGVTAVAQVSARTRYWRADTSRSDSAGLGLAIVERVMSTQRGQFSLGARAGRGAVATLEFQTPSA